MNTFSIVFPGFCSCAHKFFWHNSVSSNNLPHLVCMTQFDFPSCAVTQFVFLVCGISGLIILSHLFIVEKTIIMNHTRGTSWSGNIETKSDPDTEEEIDEDAEEDTVFMTDENGEVIRPSSCSSVRRVSNAISKMSLEKKKIISDIFFSGLLKLPQLNKVDRGFTFWLLNHLDCSGSKFVVNGRDDIKIEAADVERILGIPRGGNPVRGLGTDDPEKKFHFIQFTIGAEEDQANSLLAAKMMLKKSMRNQ